MKTQIEKSKSNTDADKQKNPIKNLSLRFVDNRPENVTQNKLVNAMTDARGIAQVPLAFAGRQKQPPIQRLVAVAGTDSDALVANNIGYARGQFGDPVVAMDRNSDFSQLGSKNRVGIVGHGAPGHIDNKSGAVIADILTQGGQPIPQETRSITLYSCNAALDKNVDEPSLVSALSAALHQKGYKILVSGMYGICFAFEGINERTTKGPENQGDEAWFPLKAKLLGGKYKHLSNGKGGFLATNEILANDGVENADSLSIEAKAAEISRILKPFWRDVKAEMDSDGSLSDHLSGWLSVLTLNQDDLIIISNSYQA